MEKRCFDDPTIPAFFRASGKPFKIGFQKNNAGRIEFIVSGEHIDKALSELFANEKVGSLDFIRELKSLRSAIFALKGTL